jgi:hypothetical protein
MDWGLLLLCKLVVSVYCCCYGLFPLVADFWSEEILRIACHLAAKFGTKHAVFAVEDLFAICESYRGVVLLFMFLLVDAVFII